MFTIYITDKDVAGKVYEKVYPASYERRMNSHTEKVMEKRENNLKSRWSDGSVAGESDGGGADAPLCHPFFVFCGAAVIPRLIPVTESPPVIQLNIYTNEP